MTVRGAPTNDKANTINAMRLVLSTGSALRTRPFSLSPERVNDTPTLRPSCLSHQPEAAPMPRLSFPDARATTEVVA